MTLQLTARCSTLAIAAIFFLFTLANNALAHIAQAGELTIKKHDLDITVSDQDGRELNFYSDLIKDKTVIINFIFTTDTTISPPLAATFARARRDMGERAGNKISFISVSVDPATDTPERLKAWGDKFNAGPGWTFVTGEKAQINRLLKALSESTLKEDHSPMVIIGNDRAGYWRRTYGLQRPSSLIEMIDMTASRVP